MTIHSILEANKDYIIRKYADGATTRKIAVEFNCNCAYIWMFLKENNIPTRKRQKFDGDISEIEPIVVADFDQNTSMTAISKKYKLCVPTISRILKKYGRDTSKFSDHRDDKLVNHKEEIIKKYLNGESTIKLAEDFGTSSSTIWKLLDSNDIKIRPIRKYSVNHNFFDTIDTPEKSYCSGLWYADGNVRTKMNGIRLQITDLELLEKVKVCFGYTGPILYRKPRNERCLPQYLLDMYSPQLAKSLVDKGCPCNKTFLIKFPYEIIPKDLMHYFILGATDGDGSIGQCKKRWRIQIVGTRHFVEGIAATTNVTKPYYYQRFPERKKDNWTLHICRKNDVFNFLQYIYQDPVIFLQRKFAKYQEFLEYYTNTKQFPCK